VFVIKSITSLNLI